PTGNNMNQAVRGAFTTRPRRSWPPLSARGRRWPRVVPRAAACVHGSAGFRLRSCGRRPWRRNLPATGLAFVLLLEPLLQRREVFEHRRAVDLLAAGELLHRLLPRLARALVQHRPELLPGGLAVVEAAFVQRSLVAGRVAQRLVELELQDVGEEVARVRRDRKSTRLNSSHVKISYAVF